MGLIKDLKDLYAHDMMQTWFMLYWDRKARAEWVALEARMETLPDGVQSLINYVRGLTSGSKKNYNMRVAPEDKSFELSGYQTGGVTPIGMSNTNVPIILAKAITELSPRVFWLGAGHLDWKVAVNLSNFIHATNCDIVDLE
ncbi:hypothetical protein HK101_010625 [Irineochytrium annulatum]|nr:hypothetical protein HK101_010625 [Irineochytrium annulatum]